MPGALSTQRQGADEWSYESRWESESCLLLCKQRITIVYFQSDPETPWFRAKPVHHALGATKIGQTLARVHVEDKGTYEDLIKRKGRPFLKGGLSAACSCLPDENNHNEMSAYYVNESGLYKVLIGSNKPQAEIFQRWLTREVLPSIRKTGQYNIGGDTEKVFVEVSAGSYSAAPASSEMLHSSAAPPPSKRSCPTAPCCPPSCKRPRLHDDFIIIKDKLKERYASPALSGPELNARLRLVGGFLKELLLRERGEHEVVQLLGHNPKKCPRAHESLLEGAIQMATNFHEGVVVAAASTCRNGEDGTFPEAEDLRRAVHSSCYKVKSDAHDNSKSITVSMFIRALTLHGCRQEALILYLDDFVADLERYERRHLRTTEALLSAGYRDLYSMNYNETIVGSLRHRGVCAYAGDFMEALTMWGTKKLRFSAAYLDFCGGSAAKLQGRLRAFFEVCEPSCVLGYTLVGRDFEGEDLIFRVMKMNRFMRDAGWKPAFGVEEDSAMKYKSSGGIDVITQFWSRKTVAEARAP